MANCTSETRVFNFLFDLREENILIRTIESILSQDNDLSVNEDMFQEDTLELGYKDEVERIIKEYFQVNLLPITLESCKRCITYLFNTNIANQEFFGVCDIQFIEVDKDRMFISVLIGGQ